MAKNWAIAIGINEYDNLRPLKYAKRDAEAIKDWCEKEGNFECQGIFLFTEDSPPIPSRPPIPTQPTYGRLKRFLQKQFEKPLLQPEDNLWFFFAGHGRRYQDKDYLMLPDSDPGNVGETAVSVDYLTERLRRSGADNVVLLLDACRDEDSRGGLGIGEEEHRGVITFYSCAPNQQSWEIEELEHGSFTHTLLEGLRLQGEGNCATVERLDDYLRRQVPAVNARYGKPRQNPALKAEPPCKLYFILLEQAATLRDAQPLKLQASLAENEGNWQMARMLWIRVLSVSKMDWDAIRGIERIAQKQLQQQPTPEPVPEPIEQPRGERSSTVGEADSKGRKIYKKLKFETIFVNKKGEKIRSQEGEVDYYEEPLGEGVEPLKMIAIPAGEFWMGSPESKEGRLDGESPQHLVKVPAFFMGQTQVTQAQWRAVASLPQEAVELKPNHSWFKGDELPVENVTWEQCLEFCARLSRYTGRNYRLPSEAEWEYACRAIRNPEQVGGGSSRKPVYPPFHYGETLTAEIANYDASNIYQQEPKGECRSKTTPVKSFPPNAFGLYDMHGNVWERCLDPWHENYEGAPEDGSVWDEENNNNNCYQNILSSINVMIQDERSHIIRGGSWGFAPRRCRSASRYGLDDVPGDAHVSFRVVWVPQDS